MTRAESLQATRNLLTVAYRLAVVVLLSFIVVKLTAIEVQSQAWYESECIATKPGKIACLYWPFDLQRHIKISSRSD